MVMLFGVSESDNQQTLNYSNGVEIGKIMAGFAVVIIGLMWVTAANATYYPPNS